MALERVIAKFAWEKLMALARDKGWAEWHGRVGLAGRLVVGVSPRRMFGDVTSRT